jgi:threonine synthase
MQSNHKTSGNTPLINSQKLGKFLGINKLYIKYEGTNPTGTQKDRSASLTVRQAVDLGFDKIVAGSCGNYGTSIAYYASLYHIKSVIYIPKQFHSNRLIEIERKYGAELKLVDGKYEDSVETSKQDAKNNGWYDGNAGAHPELGLEAFSGISYEIYKSIGGIPDTVSVPVGNGTTLAGIFHGFEKIRKELDSPRNPRMIAASTDGGNPVIESFKNNEKKIRDFPIERIKETEINEPLVNYHSYDGELAFDALVRSRGFAEYVSDEELEVYKNLIKQFEGINPIPAATASIAATARIAGNNKLPGIHIAIITG